MKTFPVSLHCIYSITQLYFNNMTIKFFSSYSGIDTKLIGSVIRQLGYDGLSKECQSTLKDIASNGINGGFCGFTYYADTHNFFRKNKKQIISMLEDDAKEFDTDVIAFVRSFNCIHIDSDTNKDIYSALYGRSGQSIITNALAWYAAEKVAYAFDNIINQ